MRYRIYGLSVRSDINLPAEAADDSGPSDVNIVIERPASLPPPWRQCGPIMWSVRGALRVAVPNRALIQVESGTSIRCWPAPGVRPQELAAQIMTTGLGILLQQRGFAILHAAAVRLASHALLLLGPAGAGKSTLAAALDMQGHTILADDMAAIDARGEVHPSGLSAALWQDALDLLELPGQEPTRIRPELAKYWWRPNSPCALDACPVRLIAVLDKTLAAAPTMSAITGFDRLELLYRHVPRRQYLHVFSDTASTFKACTQLCRSAKFATLFCPRIPVPMHQVLELLQTSAET